MLSIVFVPLAGTRDVSFGVAFLPRTQAWLVWLSTFGADVEVLTAWPEKALAADALKRYVAATHEGPTRLLEEIRLTRDMPGQAECPLLTPQEEGAIICALRGTSN